MRGGGSKICVVPCDQGTIAFIEVSQYFNPQNTGNLVLRQRRSPRKSKRRFRVTHRQILLAWSVTSPVLPTHTTTSKYIRRAKIFSSSPL